MPGLDFSLINVTAFGLKRHIFRVLVSIFSKVLPCIRSFRTLLFIELRAGVNHEFS
jgi:hypothetical protein